MPGITFDAAGRNLGDVFHLLPPRMQALEWRASVDFELVPPFGGGDVVQRVYAAADAGVLIPPDVLAAVVEMNPQAIDGELKGFQPASTVPAIVLRSVRGDEWDIEADDDAVLADVAAAVPGCKALPEASL